MELRRRLGCSGIVGLVLLSLCGCQSLRFANFAPDRPAPAPGAGDVPAKTQLRIAPYVFYADFQLNRNLPIFQELAHLREQVYKELRLPDSNAIIQVYLFADKERYEQFMEQGFPKLPKRRAFFVRKERTFGGGEDLLVFTYWGDRINQDLRHELTHALLHSVLKDVPLWLDEGLAEYFELPPSHRGINYQHLAYFQRGPFQPDLTRLEQLKEVQDMTPAEYRESWAWVHLMLQSSPETKRVLLGYLHELRASDKPGALRPRLAGVLPSPEDSLRRYVTQLDQVREASWTAPR
jgi:hypothetical protein